MTQNIAFIGGGNMACAIISGLQKQGRAVAQFDVVEPNAQARDKILGDFGIVAQAQAGAFLARAQVVLWAVKPQLFREATQAVAAHTSAALHLSVAAGIRSDSISRWLGNERVIRAMPNTPALIGQGITALFARAAVSAQDRHTAERIVAGTGEQFWVDSEGLLDAVTALSGSGPAYMFYFMEAMIAAGTRMGLSPAQAYRLATATFIGAGALARASTEPPEVLRQRVTSKGGTTYAAITSMDDNRVREHFEAAMQAACQRARELGDEFGAG
jgi:pyrroline-5-carboxylate reductase